MAMQRRVPPLSQVRLYSGTHERFGGIDGTSGTGPPRPEKQGKLKLLVSKFESLASSSNKPAQTPKPPPRPIGTLRNRWRGAVGLRPKEEKPKGPVDSVRPALLRNESLEIAKTQRAHEEKLERKENSKDDSSHQSKGSKGSVRSHSSLIVRGKKEGRRWLNGLSKRIADKKVSSGSSAEYPKAKQDKGSIRRESIVQLRVRAFERGKQDKVKPVPAVRQHSRETTSNVVTSSNLTPTTTRTQESSEARSGNERTKLRKDVQPTNKPPVTSNLQNVTVASRRQPHAPNVAPSAKHGRNVLVKQPPAQLFKDQSQRSSISAHDFADDPRLHRPSEAQVFSLAARSGIGAPRKSVAPTIRERVTMFEVAKDTKTTSVVALLGAGASAALKMRVADQGDEVHDIMKPVEFGRSEERLASPQAARLEEPSLTRGDTTRGGRRTSIVSAKTATTVSTVKSYGSTINGAYSSIARRKSNPEGKKKRSPEAPDYQYQSSQLPSAKETTRKSQPRFSPPSEQRQKEPVKPRHQSPASSLSQTDVNILTKTSSENTSANSMDGILELRSRRKSSGPARVVIAASRPMTGPVMDIYPPPAAPADTPSGTIDERVAEIIALATEDEEPIISQGVAEDYAEIERLGSAMGGMKEMPIGPAAVTTLTASSSKSNQQSKVGSRVRTPQSRPKSSLSRLLGAKELPVLPVPVSGLRDRDGSAEKENVDKGKGMETELENEYEGRTLIVQSIVEVLEPKPLRLVEVSRMLRMCRFGRSRSGGRLSSELERLKI